MSAEDEELVSERKKIEDYLKLYCIEDVIDEALNKLVDVRPSNPYVALGQMIQAKTMPEIIDVKIHPICSANARGGVKASVITNLGTFYAYAGEAAGVSEGDTLRNYFSIEDRISSHMKSLNPCDMKQIDEYLDSVEDLEESVSLAVSMACCRAGAHHKGISLYRFLAELTDSNAGLPMPVVTVLSRAIGETEDASHTYHSQDITVIPTACTSVDNAIECCLQATSAVKIGVEERIKAGGMDIFELLQGVNGGCPRAKVSSLEAAMVLVKESLEKSAVLGEMRLGVDMHTGKVFVKGDEDVGAMYAVDGPENPLAGSDVNDTIISAWEATELISVEDPFLRDDIESLRDLQEVYSLYSRYHLFRIIFVFFILIQSIASYCLTSISQHRKFPSKLMRREKMPPPISFHML